MDNQIKVIDKEYTECNATGLCQARARVMQDILENDRNIQESIKAQENIKFKGETKGRRNCEPTIFDTLEKYDVRYNDLPLNEKTKLTLQQLGKKWFLSRDYDTVKSELKNLIDATDWYNLFNKVKFNIEDLRNSLLGLGENRGAIISMQGISTGDSTSVYVFQSNHAVLVFKKEGHLFLIDSYNADIFADVLHKPIPKVLENTDALYDFLTYNLRRYITQYQESLTEAETELRELNEALSSPPTSEELATLQSKINEVVSIRKLLITEGFEEPHADFNSVIDNFFINIRHKP